MELVVVRPAGGRTARTSCSIPELRPRCTRRSGNEESTSPPTAARRRRVSRSSRRDCRRRAPAPNGITRVALAISPSSPQTLYALIANNDTTSPPPGPPYSYAVDKLYMTSNGGANWSAIALPGGAGTGIGGQGFYNLHIAVDPTTPDIIYFGGIELWKGTRSAGIWTITKVGGNLHPDHHFLAVHPTNHLMIYAGNDGGMYRSTDGGATWDDSINKGLVDQRQYEFIETTPRCCRDRRHTGQRHGAVPQQPGLLSCRRWRRRVLR